MKPPTPAQSTPQARNRWGFLWGQKLGKPECPYLKRWGLLTPYGSVRVHHWLRGDDPRAMHDHSWWFWTCVLWGSYVDVTPGWGNEDGYLFGPEYQHRFTMRPFRPRFRRAKHIHTVETRGCWTLIITGPHTKFWGFYRVLANGLWRFVKANKWHAEEGGVPCE